MNQKTTLILAVSLTAFLLVIGGAIAGRAALAPISQASPTAAEAQNASGDVQNVLLQRDAAYRALLDEANQRLAALYDAQATATPGVPEPATAPVQASAAISQSQAALIALVANPNARLLSRPELVDFQGTTAYEVKLNQGTVYVDASTGAILYNGALQTVLAQRSAPTGASTSVKMNMKAVETNLSGDRRTGLCQ